MVTAFRLHERNYNAAYANGISCQTKIERKKNKKKNNTCRGRFIRRYEIIDKLANFMCVCFCQCHCKFDSIKDHSHL